MSETGQQIANRKALNPRTHYGYIHLYDILTDALDQTQIQSMLVRLFLPDGQHRQERHNDNNVPTLTCKHLDGGWYKDAATSQMLPSRAWAVESRDAKLHQQRFGVMQKDQLRSARLLFLTPSSSFFSSSPVGCFFILVLHMGDIQIFLFLQIQISNMILTLFRWSHTLSMHSIS